MQVPELALKVAFVVLPRHSVHAGSRVLLQFEERSFQPTDRDVMQQRGEPLLPVAPCSLPYAFPRL